jgi:hypothetical protein
MENKLNQTQIKKLHIISIIMSSIFILFGSMIITGIFSKIFSKHIVWIFCIICFISSILSLLLCIYSMLKIKSNTIQIINFILVVICICFYLITTTVLSPFFHLYKDTEIEKPIYIEDTEFEQTYQDDSD